MNECVSELRSVVRRLRPHLVFRPTTDSKNLHHVDGHLDVDRYECVDSIANDELTMTPTNDNVEGKTRFPSSSTSSMGAVTAESRKASEELAILKEIQSDASSELVDALSSFIWSLDSQWSNELNSNSSCFAVENDLGNGKERGASEFVETPRLDLGNDETGKETVNSHNEQRCKKNKPRKKLITEIATKSNNCNSTILEPDTIWNDDAKSLVREGYGLILSSFSTFSTEVSRRYVLYGDRYHDKDKSRWLIEKHEETTRTLVRTSILQLLPSLATSACRHFLLGFLPHFTPLEMHNRQCYRSIHGIADWSPPSWLLEDLDKEKTTNSCDMGPKLRRFGPSMEEDTTLTEAVTQMLDTFQSLISIDPSTLAPFLSTLSVFFEDIPSDGSSSPTTDENENDVNISTTINPTTSRENARKYCFELCLSSLSSISEHDLPSLLHSLFILVRNRNEGNLVMKAVRQERVEVCASHHCNLNEYACDEHTDVTSVAYIGNVIVGCMLSDQLPGSRFLAVGFLDAVTDSLNSSKDRKQQRSSNEKETFQFTTLDLVILVALYINRRYQQSVEEIVDELMCHDKTSMMKLSNELIKSWSPVSRERKIYLKIRKEKSDSSLLYDLLSSPMISLMFYMLMSPSSSEGNRYSHKFSSIIRGGILSCHYDSASIGGSNGGDKIDCCEVFSDLYFTVDIQRQEQIISSLLAMMSESFVWSCQFDLKRARYRKKSQDGKHHANRGSDSGTERRNLQLLLLSASAACRVLMLICRRDASNKLQMKSILLDRVLSFASITQQISSSDKELEGAGHAVTYDLFDMNCALLVAILHDNFGEEGGIFAEDETQNISTDYHASGTSDVLIICQKLLFSDNIIAHACSNKEVRAVCGLILASRLLRCKYISRPERGNVWNWVLAVLSAAPSSSSGPQSRYNMIAPIQSLDPVIAHWGLSFLKFASSTVSCQSKYPEISRLVDTNSVCGQSDVFRQVNKMLATAAFVQMEDALRLPLREKEVIEGRNAGKTFLAYAEVPEHFITKNPPRERRFIASLGMVMSAPYFLYGKLSKVGSETTSVKSTDLPSICGIANYVHDLVDKYLELGRQNCSGAPSSKTSSWNPRGWLLAKVQLPCLPPSLLRLFGIYNYRLELDCKETHRFPNTPRSPDTGCQSNLSSLQSNMGIEIQNGKWKVLFVEVLKETSNPARLVQNMVEFANCLTVSIGASIAVLKHAHCHYLDQYMDEANSRSQLSDENQGDRKSSDSANKPERRKKKQEQALKKLIQFQLAKIFDMQRLCRTILLVLEFIHFERCGDSKSLPPNQRAQKVSLTDAFPTFEGRGVNTSHIVLPKTKASYASRSSSAQVMRNFKFDNDSVLTSIKVYLDSSARSIRNSIFWSCLLDKSDDRILHRGVEFLVNQESDGIHKSSSTMSQSTAPVHIAFFVFRLRRKAINELQQNIIHQKKKIPSYRLPLLSKVGDGNSKFLGIDGLTIPGFSKLFCSTIFCTSHLNQLGRNRKSTKRLDESYSILQTYVCSLYKLVLTILTIAAEGDKPDLIRGAQISDHEKKNSMRFSMMLQRCAEHMQTDMAVLDKTGNSYSSTATPAIFLKGVLLRQLELCEDASIACFIVDLVSIILIQSNCSRANLAKITHGAVTSVYTTGTVRVNLPYAFFTTVHMIIDQAQHTPQSKDKHLVTEVFSNFLQLANTLQKSKDSQTTTFIHLILSHWSSVFLDENEMQSYLRLLQDSVWVVLNTTKRKSSNGESCASPLPIVSTKNIIPLFQLVLQMVVSFLSVYDPPHIKRSFPTFRGGPFDGMLSLLEFYSSSMLLFETNSDFFPRKVFFQVTKTSLITIKLCEYKLQRCVEWRSSCRTLSDIGSQEELGSPESLQPLVNSIARNCLGTIASFCSSVKKCNMKDPLRLVKRGGLSVTYKDSKVIAGLVFRCERLKETLSSICQVQHLTLPSFSESTDNVLKSINVKRHFGNDDRGTGAKYRRLEGRKRIRNGQEISSDFEQDDPLVNTCDYGNDDKKVAMTNEIDYDDCNSLEDEYFASDDNESFGAVGDWGY